MTRTCLICGTEYLEHAGVQACIAEHERAQLMDEHEDVRLEVARVPFSAELAADSAFMREPCTLCGRRVMVEGHAPNCVAALVGYGVSHAQRPIRTTIHWRALRAARVYRRVR